MRSLGIWKVTVSGPTSPRRNSSRKGLPEFPELPELLLPEDSWSHQSTTNEPADLFIRIAVSPEKPATAFYAVHAPLFEPLVRAHYVRNNAGAARSP